MDVFVCVCEFSHFSQQCENLINCFCSFDISFASSRTKAHLLISHFTLPISSSVMPAQKETMYDSNFRGSLLLHRCQLRQHTLQHLSVLFPGCGSEAVSTVNDLKSTSWMNPLFSSQFQIRGSAVGTVCLPFPTTGTEWMHPFSFRTIMPGECLKRNRASVRSKQRYLSSVRLNNTETKGWTGTVQ